MSNPNAITFRCLGVPRPGGSKRGFVHRSTGRVVMVDMGKNVKGWRAEVAHEGALAMRDRPPLSGALRLTVTFEMPRPMCHFTSKTTGYRIKATSPKWHTKAPDTTKLLRSTEDALKGVCWLDDSQVAVQIARKIFADGPPGATITIEPLDNDLTHQPALTLE